MAVQIIVNQLSYVIPDSSVRFDKLSLSFAQYRYGITGDNGLGKTTFLKLIAKQLEPQSGLIQQLGKLSYCPQNYYPKNPAETIAETLGVSVKLEAIARIEQGDLCENNYALVGDDWDIEARCQELFSEWHLGQIDLNQGFLSLSAGQQTKCLLIRSILANADFILFDEPTNNLDYESKKLFYNWISRAKLGLLVVSHDRELLDYMDEILEITSKGLQRYGGNYSFFEEQKNIQQQAVHKNLAEAKRKIKQSERSIQQAKEKNEQAKKKGKVFSSKEKDKILIGFKKDVNQKSQAKNATRAEKMLAQAEDNLTAAREKIEIKEPIQADLSKTAVPKAKMIIEIDNMSFSYGDKPALFSNFNFSLVGSERVALLGRNGAGKTTLVNLMLGKIVAQQGQIKRGLDTICYLDQKMDFLDSSLSILENFQKLNPDLSTQDAYFALASFNFRNKEAEKLLVNLSGGERIRSALAISLLSKMPPQCIILDEPTNHLDLRSIQALELILNAYKGALLVICHDETFLENIHIERRVKI